MTDPTPDPPATDEPSAGQVMVPAGIREFLEMINNEEETRP